LQRRQWLELNEFEVHDYNHDEITKTDHWDFRIQFVFAGKRDFGIAMWRYGEN